MEDFEYARADVVVATKFEGFAEITQRIRDGSIPLKGYRFIVFMIGRADLVDSESLFRIKVSECIKEVEDRNPTGLVLLCGLLPTMGESREMVKLVLNKNDVLRNLCSNSNLREFGKPGKQLLAGNAACKFFYDDWGKLNDEGYDQLRDAICHKFNAAQLRKRSDQIYARASFE